MDPKNLSAHFFKAQIFFRQHAFDLALHSIKLALECPQQSAQPRLLKGTQPGFVSDSLLGQIHYHLGEWDLAMADFVMAAEIDPDLVTALQWQADTFIRKREPQAAVELFDKILAIEPNNSLTHDDKGQALFLCEKFEEALKSFDTAIAMEPTEGRAQERKVPILVVYDAHHVSGNNSCHTSKV